MAKGRWQEWITPEGLTLLEGWARDGLTDEQIAKNIGISRQTLYDWKKRYPDISYTLKKGKEVVDIEVENALLKRALGYKYVEVTKERMPKKDEFGNIMEDEEGNWIFEMVPIKEVVKEVQPDTTAQIFWLKNRRPDKWRDKQEVEQSGDLQININVRGSKDEHRRND
ncbi:helix-turn-helix domain-containing protein [Aneurinibacillus aneurinilyticus]|uniref:Uncharacterized protein n=1 Tax=Aneurinibacillus aneurinilyticus ATCC 12856 TaxID=649747 RepID=U1WW52_ANEAE|nr:helix-turn-helix domain-containing protein [Aneurinibacillus aneurinilyticus]ERI06478.1 hypothetical protein HMPREF0083_05320 [Aneurinibacillus aneurinilyticus ATCC 12856]MED0707093.1 helix-turn-helix domain-containing protein [Aneurinibacillus aneurinilyticus]MED0732838.1 helix-turn-helix domain-containing protein [Aneurinibacillus aneurinilyticus]MED0740392.1 helix-turn-helix domain-containing protein [Aneurinibacillus aneurinilyticus]